jgi:hypothetical protein
MISEWVRPQEARKGSDHAVGCARRWPVGQALVDRRPLSHSLTPRTSHYVRRLFLHFQVCKHCHQKVGAPAAPAPAKPPLPHGAKPPRPTRASAERAVERRFKGVRRRRTQQPGVGRSGEEPAVGGALGFTGPRRPPCRHGAKPPEATSSVVLAPPPSEAPRALKVQGQGVLGEGFCGRWGGAQAGEWATEAATDDGARPDRPSAGGRQQAPRHVRTAAPRRGPAGRLAVWLWVFWGVGKAWRVGSGAGAGRAACWCGEVGAFSRQTAPKGAQPAGCQTARWGRIAAQRSLGLRDGQRARHTRRAICAAAHLAGRASAMKVQNPPCANCRKGAGPGVRAAARRPGAGAGWRRRAAPCACVRGTLGEPRPQAFISWPRRSVARNGSLGRALSPPARPLNCDRKSSRRPGPTRKRGHRSEGTQNGRKRHDHARRCRAGLEGAAAARNQQRRPLRELPRRAASCRVFVVGAGPRGVRGLV